MMSTNQIAEVGLLVGEPARTSMLLELMDGRARTAGELAACAGVSPQTASGHLSRLTAAGLLVMHRQGRHRYHRLASARVATLLENIMQVAAETPRANRGKVFGPRDTALRRARTCYDHFAGGLGVAITDVLTERGVIVFDDEAGVISESGLSYLRERGISVELGRARGRAICRPCLDWSERRPHVAGRVGAAICRHFVDAGLVRRIDGSRALEITTRGRRALRTHFGIDARQL